MTLISRRTEYTAIRRDAPLPCAGTCVGEVSRDECAGRRLICSFLGMTLVPSKIYEISSLLLELGIVQS